MEGHEYNDQENSKMEHWEKALQEYRAMKVQMVAGTSSRPPPQELQKFESVLPPDVYARASSGKDPLQERLDRMLALPPPKVVIPEIFANLEIPKDMRPVKEDFPDDAMINEMGISLDRLLDDEIVTIGRVVIPMISSGFSKKGAASIFTIAYHLRGQGKNCDGDYVFQETPELRNMFDKDYSDYGDNILSVHGTSVEIIPIDNIRKEAAIYSFVAASLLRLFARSAKNYIFAWKHILDGFPKFYGKQIELQLPTPNELAIKGLSDWFSVEPRAKVTLYRLLYMGNANDNNRGLKRYLYDVHLSNTGMHLTSHLLQLSVQMNCSPELILTILNNGQTSTQIECLFKLLKIMKNPDEKHTRHMWRYGRIFDETFMAPLQTKACPKLVYVTASALRQLAPETHGNILNIVQLADVSEENRRKGDETAKQMLRVIRDYQSEETTGDRRRGEQDGGLTRMLGKISI